jgi:putative flippase GtrA
MVTLVSPNPLRSQTTRWQAVRFVAVGAANTLDYYLIFVVLNRVTWYLLAHVLAFAVSACFSFLLNCYFTYRVRPTWRKFGLFPLAVSVNFAVTTVSLVALVQLGDLAPPTAAIIAAAVAVPFTFLLSRRILIGIRLGESSSGVLAGRVPRRY